MPSNGGGTWNTLRRGPWRSSRASPESAPHVGSMSPREYRWSLGDFTWCYWIGPCNPEVLASFLSASAARQEVQTGSTWLSCCSPCCGYCSVLVPQPHPLLWQNSTLYCLYHFKSFFLASAWFCAKRRFFSMGCYLLPSPAPAGPMKGLPCNGLMTQLIYFKHLKHTPPSANPPAASCCQRAGPGPARGLLLLFEIWGSSPGIRTLPVQGRSKATVKLDIFTASMRYSERIARGVRNIGHRNIEWPSIPLSKGRNRVQTHFR